MKSVLRLTQFLRLANHLCFQVIVSQSPRIFLLKSHLKIVFLPDSTDLWVTLCLEVIKKASRSVNLSLDLYPDPAFSRENYYERRLLVLRFHVPSEMKKSFESFRSSSPIDQSINCRHTNLRTDHQSNATAATATLFVALITFSSLSFFSFKGSQIV